MDARPLVSIITPSYNQAPFLEQTIRSVLGQDYPALEYIVIDGGSTDGSVEVIQRYADRLAHWVSEPDQGQSHAINKGLRKARGDLLTWINSDDTLAAGAVRRVVEALEAEPEVDVIYGSVNWIDATGKVIARPSRFSRAVVFDRSNLISNNVTQAGAFWRRTLMEKAGALDESLHYVMDYDLWVRMALAGGKFQRLIGDPLANRRMSADAKTITQNDRMGLEKLMLLDRLLADPDLPAKLAIPAEELKQQERKARAVACLRVFFAYSKRAGHRERALRWLVKALRYQPAILVSRNFIKSMRYYSLIR